MDDIVSYQFAQVRQRRDERQEIQYELILRQQPKQSRMCGIGEKADRRPIDPPPIIQLKVYDASLPQSEKSSFLQNPYFFMYASLVAPDTDEELHLLRDGKTRSTTGSVVSSLYHLKDIDNSDAGFFVFPDLSVRMEGTYRLKLSLFEIIGREVYHCKSIFSEIFIVYSAKRFPGMEESTFLSRSFADQGLKIRIRRLAKRDRKELELIDHSLSNRLKRHRGDGKRDDDSGDSSDVDMHDRTPNADDSRSKLNSEINRKDHNSISPSSPRRYDHMPHMHYDPNASMYGPGYPPHRPHPWHDRPEYMAEHYPPYYEPYDRRYGYHPYYYPHPPPMPDSAEHHRYPYPPAYGRPPMYPTQPGPPYYDAPSRVGHPANESQGPVRPYGYDPSSPYPPQRGAPWPHYGERSQSRDPNLESSSSPYRPSTPLPPRGHPMYPYPPHPDYYAPYAHPPMVPPPPKPADYAAQNPSSLTEDPQSKIPIQDLLSTEQQQQQQNQSQQNQQQNQLPQQQQQSQSSQPNTEQNSVVPPPLPQQRMYGVPPSAFAHIYPHHPVRPHEYMRHDMYGRPYDVGYPPQPHDAAVSPYGQSAGSNSSPLNKSQPTSQPTSQPPQASQSDTARTSLISTSSPTQTPSSTSSESVRQESRNAEYNTYDSARRSTYSSEREPLTSTGNPSVAPSSNSSSTPTTQASSSYSGMPVMPTATRTGPIALPPLSYMAPSGNSIAYHSATSTSSLHTSTSSSQQLKSPPQLKSPSQTQASSSYDHPTSYPQSASSSQNRGSYGITSGSDHGSGNNSSKNNGVNTNLGSGNEKTTTTLSTSPRAAAGFEGKYPRRQGGDVEGERKVNESVSSEKY